MLSLEYIFINYVVIFGSQYVVFKITYWYWFIGPTKSTKPVEQDPLDAENDEDHEEEAEPEEEPVKIEPKTPKKAAPVKKEVPATPATPKRVVKEQAKPVEKIVKVSV